MELDSGFRRNDETLCELRTTLLEHFRGLRKFPIKKISDIHRGGAEDASFD